jgi:DNA-binding beta-propeller fold protein YncE
MMRRIRIAGLVLATICALLTSFARGEAHTLALYAVRHDGVEVLDALLGTPMRMLHVDGLPNDVAVAPGGDLYVASFRRSTTNLVISRFAPNASTPFFTIVSQNYAGSLAVSKTGELAVQLSCAPSQDGCFGCRVSNPLPLLFFEPGAHRPSRERSFCGGASKPAYGPDGDLWLVSPFARRYDGASYSYLDPNSLHLTQVILQTALIPLAPQFSAGPVLDGRGDLLTLEAGGLVKAYGAKTGRLRFTVPIVGIVDGAHTMAVSPNGAYLFVSTVHGFICVYNFPAGGMPLAIYDAGGTGAIAVGFI